MGLSVMIELLLLQQQAMTSAIWRGHAMGSWEPGNISTCKRCGAWVQVLVNPAPSQIDIGGPAVAVQCEEEANKV